MRACLAGENLDWIGFNSVCAAIDLPTTARSALLGDEVYDGPLLDLVWKHVSQLPGPLPSVAPRVSVEQCAPVASGLATSSALVMCLLQLMRESCGSEALSSEKTIETAYELERMEANGGGMDQLCIGHGGAFLLQGRTDGVPRVVERAPWPEEWCFVVVDSGVGKHTPTHIAEVRRRLEQGDPSLQRYVEIADRCAADVWTAIRSRNLPDVKALLDRAHRAMRDYQRTSTQHLERLRDLALDCGCGGLKLSGAGGGGVLFTVATVKEAPQMVKELQAALCDDGSSVRVLAAQSDNRGMRRLKWPIPRPRKSPE